MDIILEPPLPPMRTTKTIIALILFFFTSCSKEILPDPIIGKWQIQEVYNGYTNGGNFQWQSVPEQQKISISFYNDGSFIENRPSALPSQCNGTYTIINQQEIKTSSNCYGDSYSFLYEVVNNNLIITHLVREGEIKEKFIKIL
jgi:hypothetical protein